MVLGGKMKTYLTVFFNSDGDRPSEVTKTFKDLGFKLTRGDYDYRYDWDEDTSSQQIESIGDKIQELLKGKKILFQLENSEGGKHQEPDEDEMKTYLKLVFRSEGGEAPSDIDEKIADLMSIGFEPIKGEYDYVYRWPEDSNIEGALEVADRVYEALKGCGVFFKLKTV